MKEWLDQLFEIEELIKKIVDLLPEDDPGRALTAMSMAIDIYSCKIGRDSKKTWDACYAIAMEVHEECGSYYKEEP